MEIDKIEVLEKLLRILRLRKLLANTNLNNFLMAITTRNEFNGHQSASYNTSIVINGNQIRMQLIVIHGN